MVSGAIVFVTVWELVGRLGWLGDSFPPMSAVVLYIVDVDRSDLLRRSLLVTLGSASLGLGVGAVLAVTGAAIAAVFPLLGIAVARVSVILHSIPLIAFGPILITTAGRESAPWIAAVLGAYYPIYVAVDSGFRYAPHSYHDLVAVVGGSRARQFRFCVVPHAIPAMVDGLRLGVPGALLGAILGEWFGAPRGLGVLIVSSMQNYQIEQLWAAALLGAACSIAAYAILAPVQHAAQRRFAW